jgi:hypothetical protein
MTDPELVAILKRLAAGQPARSSHAGTFGAAAAAIEGLTREVARLTAERDAVIDLCIGYDAPDEDNSGVYFLKLDIVSNGQEFENRAEVVAAIRRAAKLTEGT